MPSFFRTTPYFTNPFLFMENFVSDFLFVVCLFISFKYTCLFQKKMLFNLTFVLIYSLTKCVLEDGFKDNCSENFVIFAEKYLWQSFLLRKLRDTEYWFFWTKIFLRNLQYIQLKKQYKFGLLTVIYLRNDKLWLFKFWHYKLFFFESMWSCCM